MAQGVASQLSDESTSSYDGIGADYPPFSFTVRKNVLLDLCEQAASVVPSRDFQPVLKNFQVDVSPDGIRVAATDMELAVLAFSPAVGADAPHMVRIDARRLLECLRAAPEGEVTIRIEGNRADVEAGPVSWTLFLADGTDYPELPNPADMDLQEISRMSLLTALRAVRHAVGREGGRSQLRQVNIAPGTDGEMRVTACDSARLAQVPVYFPFPAAIPAGALDELLRLLAASTAETLAVAQAEDGKLVFKLGSTVFTTEPPPSRFPDVEKLLLLKPQLENKHDLVVSRAALIEAIRRVRITADPETAAIALRLRDGQVEVISRDKGGNAARQVVEAAWQYGERQLVVSHQFLADLLGSCGTETVEVSLGPDSAKRKSMLLVRDGTTGLAGVVSQMVGALVGYE